MSRLWIALGLCAAALLAGCERPPVNTVQRGYRGTGMDEVYNPRLLAEQAPNNAMPADPPMVPPGGPPAKDRLQERAGCRRPGRRRIHTADGLDDGLGLARSGLHLLPQGRRRFLVGCALHQGHRPAHAADDPPHQHRLEDPRRADRRHLLHLPPRPTGAGERLVCTAARSACRDLHRQSRRPEPPQPSVGLASLPFDPFTPFLTAPNGQSNEIRVVGKTALQDGNRQSIKQAEFTYGLMMHMSKALGVNCTYCHNSRSFADWDTSTPQRATAWYGIRLARDLNSQYLESLAGTLPPSRLGPAGDVPKVNCTTCHQGAFKPMYGASLLATHPELAGVRETTATPAVDAASASASASAPAPAQVAVK